MKAAKFILTLTTSLFVIMGAAYTPSYILESQNKVLVATRNINDKTYNKEFKVKSGLTLKLDLKIGSDIQVESWNKEIVSINARIGGRSAKDIKVEFNETSDGIEVEASYEGNNNRNSDGMFTIKVPSKFNVNFSTMGGDVSLTGIDGLLSGKTMGGELILRNLNGELELTTMGGDIELSESDVDGFVKTMGGDISFDNVTGNIDAKSMGGDIKQKNVKRRSGETIGNETNVETMGGEIIVDEAAYGAKVKTMGGNITINKASLFVDATTMGGDILIKSADGWIKATTMGGDVEVNVKKSSTTGKGDIDISSMGGDVTLYLPADFSMKLDLEIKYDQKHDNEVNINSDFKFNEERKGEWQNKNGNDIKYIYGTGSLNGGKHLVKIKTNNGNIYLKKN
ncbi:MAG: hypothetical protein KKB34_09975 [Bacteroidetes bacterium]|nr:hypothetical protein [Bacteroidota bacterium]